MNPTRSKWETALLWASLILLVEGIVNGPFLRHWSHATWEVAFALFLAWMADREGANPS